MTKKTQETLLAICDTLASGVLSYAAAARMNGIAARTFWFWIKQSQQNADPNLVIEYLGEPVAFHRAVNAARRIAMHEARGRMEQKSILGWNEPIFFNGQPTWQPEPATVGWTEDDREALGFRRDGLLEVDGRVVQNFVHHEPPVALQLRVAEMAFPQEYRPGSNQTIDVTHNGIVGIQHAKPANYSGSAPPIPPAPKLPKLEVLDGPDDVQIPETEPDEVGTEPDEVGTSDTDAELDEMLGPDPGGFVVHDADNDLDGNVSRTADHARDPLPDAPPPQPVGFNETPLRAPRNALEADLFEKLAAARARGQT